MIKLLSFLFSIGTMSKPKEVCGEEDPGFSLWTSAHGFHHYTLSHKRGWKIVWAVILLILTLSLVACIIYYFYHVFSTAVYSRVLIESPESRDWPTTIICEKQGFTFSRISRINSLNIAHASLLSWTLAPELSRPQVYAENENIPSLLEEIGFILQRGEYDNDYGKIVEALVPNCTDFILECQIGSIIYPGKDCCGSYFDSKPITSRYGTCFTTKTAPKQHKVNLAGDGSGLTVVTMHDDGSSFDRSFASSELFGASGVAFAVTDGLNSVEASLRGHGQSVQPGKLASIGISRGITDNSDLEFSAIGRMKCTNPGSRDDIDEDLIFGLNNDYGYTKDNCANAKKEILARSLLQCSFLPQNNDYKRCSPAQSATYQRSFLALNKTSINRINVTKIPQDLQERFDKKCEQDCIQDRYTLSSSYSDLSDNLKAELQSKIPSGSSKNVVVLKFFLNSMEYSKIHNFPQHGLQFVAEVGGLMAFFLGLSVVSVLECFCYCCVASIRKCTGEDREEEERERWKQAMNLELDPQKRADLRQQKFNEMQERLRQLDKF